MKGIVVIVCTVGALLAGSAGGVPVQAHEPSAVSEILPLGSISCDNYTPFDVGPGTWNIPTVGFNTGNTNCVLGVGNQSIAVTRLQEALSWCNGQNIAIDGDYGTHTRQAVLNVQRSAHIAQDGVYGPQTEGVIVWPLHDFGGGVTCTIPG